jgi:hypothetical protein
MVTKRAFRVFSMRSRAQLWNQPIDNWIQRRFRVLIQQTLTSLCNRRITFAGSDQTPRYQIVGVDYTEDVK